MKFFGILTNLLVFDFNLIIHVERFNPTQTAEKIFFDFVADKIFDANKMKMLFACPVAENLVYLFVVFQRKNTSKYTQRNLTQRVYKIKMFD